mmetsp:Transcript_96848/g.296067  ORF Transcript_96848/g.296067 Transcript_96848/m.296067 type:complete len:344 (-) Transcript_96848:106-1137(-)
MLSLAYSSWSTKTTTFPVNCVPSDTVCTSTMGLTIVNCNKFSLFALTHTSTSSPISAGTKSSSWMMRPGRAAPTLTMARRPLSPSTRSSHMDLIVPRSFSPTVKDSPERSGANSYIVNQNLSVSTSVTNTSILDPFLNLASVVSSFSCRKPDVVAPMSTSQPPVLPNRLKAPTTPMCRSPGLNFHSGSSGGSMDTRKDERESSCTSLSHTVTRWPSFKTAGALSIHLSEMSWVSRMPGSVHPTSTTELVVPWPRSPNSTTTPCNFSPTSDADIFRRHEVSSTDGSLSSWIRRTNKGPTQSPTSQGSIQRAAFRGKNPLAPSKKIWYSSSEAPWTCPATAWPTS